MNGTIAQEWPLNSTSQTPPAGTFLETFSNAIGQAIGYVDNGGMPGGPAAAEGFDGVVHCLTFECQSSYDFFWSDINDDGLIIGYTLSGYSDFIAPFGGQMSSLGYLQNLLPQVGLPVPPGNQEWVVFPVAINDFDQILLSAGNGQYYVASPTPIVPEPSSVILLATVALFLIGRFVHRARIGRSPA